MNRTLLYSLGLLLLFAGLGLLVSPDSASAMLPSKQGENVSSSPQSGTSQALTLDSNLGFKIVYLAATGKDRANSVEFSPDDRSIAVGASFGIYLLDAQTLEKRAFIPTQSMVRSLAFSPDGQFIASGQYENDIHLWRASDGSLVRTLTGHQGWVRSLAFSPDGSLLVSISDDNTLRIWRTSDGAPIRVIREGVSGVRTLAVAPTGDLLAAGMMNGEIRFWRIEDGSLVRILRGHSDWVRALAFSPDGSFLASGSFDKTVRIWKVSDGALLHTLQGHTASVLSVAFSPDGQAVASGSVDQSVRIWQISSGNLSHILSGAQDFVFSVAYSHDGRKLAVGSVDNAVRVWDVADLQSQALQPMGDKESSAPAQSCVACHHPRKNFQTARVIEMSCSTCHGQGALVLNWCPIFPRADVPIQVSVSIPADPDLVGVPHGSSDLSVQIFSPGNGEHYYAQGDILSIAQVTGKVIYTGGSPQDVSIRLISEANGNLAVLYDTHPEADGSYALILTLNPQGSEPWMLAGLPSARFSQCYLCHDQDLAGAPTLPFGLVGLRVEATAPDGQTASDERWVWRDQSHTETVTVNTTLASNGDKPVASLAVQADAVLYNWRPRTTSALTDPDGATHLEVETQPDAPTDYTFQVEPQILDGVLYQSQAAVTTTMTSSKAAPSLSLEIASRSGSIDGEWKMPAGISAPQIPVWAIRLPDGLAEERLADAQGRFVFDNLYLAAYKLVGDPYWMVDHHLILESKNLDLRQQPTSQVSGQFVSIPAGTLTGQIQAEGGAWLPFAWVSTQGGSLAQPVLPDSGHYQISGLETGKSTVIASAPGYYSQAQVIEASTDASVEDFSLAPRPGLREIAWGNGKLIIPAETTAQVQGSTITFTRGWLWGQAQSGTLLNIHVGNDTLAISSAKFAIQSTSAGGFWLYLWQGSAQMALAGSTESISLQSGQMIVLGTTPTSPPVEFTPAAFLALTENQATPIDPTWQPTPSAILRDRLAGMGISLAKLITLIVYSLATIIAVIFPLLMLVWFVRRRIHRSI
jgi:WD40 repeat protein